MTDSFFKLNTQYSTTQYPENCEYASILSFAIFSRYYIKTPGVQVHAWDIEILFAVIDRPLLQ